MTDTADSQVDRRSRRRTLAVAAVVVSTLVVLAVVEISTTTMPSAAWSAPLDAVVLAAAIAAILRLTRAGSHRAAWLAVAGVALVAIGSGIGRVRDDVDDPPPSSGAMSGDVVARLATWWVVVALGVVLVVAAVVLVVRDRRSREANPARSAVLSLASLGVGLLVITVLLRDVVTGEWISGRPVRRRSPPVRSRCRPARWRTVRVTPAPAATARASNGSTPGDLWLAAAADEAEAVVAFRDLAARCASVGAPRELVARCEAAAREEVRHARSCERIAAGLGARPTGHEVPATTAVGIDRPRRRWLAHDVELARLAVESLVDGMAGEGFAARRLEAGAGTATQAAPVLRSMAADERGHAELAADIVAWCLAEAPLVVGGSLRCAARRLPATATIPAPLAAMGGDDLAAAGLVGGVVASDLWRAARAEALTRLDALLATTPGAAPPACPRTPPSVVSWSSRVP